MSEKKNEFGWHDISWNIVKNKEIEIHFSRKKRKNKAMNKSSLSISSKFVIFRFFSTNGRLLGGVVIAENHIYQRPYYYDESTLSPNGGSPFGDNVDSS